MYAPSKSISGTNTFDPTQQLEIEMHQFEFEIGYSFYVLAKCQAWFGVSTPNQAFVLLRHHYDTITTPMAQLLALTS